MAAAPTITRNTYRGAIVRTIVVPTMVRQSSPMKKSKKAKTERGRVWGSASMTKIGTVRKSHVTIPQNTRPADAKMINFFFFDGSMFFIESLFQDENITL